MELAIVRTTTASCAEAEQIGTAVVHGRLAACVQITGPIRSIYRWKGTVESSDEWICDCKTVPELADTLMERIKTLHSYEVPEIIVLPVMRGHAAYLTWLRGEVDDRPAL